MDEKGKKNLAVLGATGSVGRQTLDVVRSLPDRFNIIALSGGKNIHLLAEQIQEFKPKFVSHSSADGNVLSRLAGNSYELLTLDELASLEEVDTVVVATSGKSGLGPTLNALKGGKTVALSNKETLVMAGGIISQAAKSGGRLLPVDSEHSAIWQCLNGETRPARLILTASGGPFHHYSRAQLEAVTAEQALKHPSWQMGKKITIDSATLMNKGLEVIEAHYLFDMPFEQISILVHPQSIVHSLVEFTDGVIKAQLSSPDMRLPIQYALSYPERLGNHNIPYLDFSQLRNLSFEPPDMDTFPCLRLAIEAGKKGGTGPAVLCAADEIAVELFLAGRLKFTGIPKLVERVLKCHVVKPSPTLEDILSADTWARRKALELATGGSSC